jgi:hypothetical protein
MDAETLDRLQQQLDADIERSREQTALDWLSDRQRTLKRTPNNEEIVRGAFKFLGIKLCSKENLLSVYRTLTEMDVPLDRDYSQRDAIHHNSWFPRLKAAGWKSLLPYCPIARILSEKRERERLAAEEQRERDEGKPLQGVWSNGSFYPANGPVQPPDAPTELAGMTRASKAALDDLGRRQVLRNTVR